MISLMIKKFTKFMKAKGKINSRAIRRKIKDHSQTSSAMDVEKLNMSRQIAQIQRKAKKGRAEHFLRKRHT